MIDTEGYELLRLPWWYSPLTKKQVHFDTYSMLSYWREMTETDVIAFLRQRGFIGEAYLLLEGEFDRRELKEQVGMFKVDPKKPTIIRRYVKRRYIPEEITSYTIIEKIELLRIFLTFSIETGTGHQQPFYAEVTCDTVITPDLPEARQDEIIRRVINGVLKFFFIVFDGGKIVFTGKKRADRDPEWLIKTLAYLQFFANPIYEGGEIDRKEQKGGMDGFLKMLMDRVEARDDFDEYVTRESILTIGIEYESTASMDYEYPSVHAEIEKVRVGHYHIERTLILAPVTDVWMDKILDMMVS